MNKNANEPAYPILDKLINQGLELKNSGLTKREIIAKDAMVGLIISHPDQIHNQQQGVKLAISWADELLKQLENEKY